ncbi:hypothetical protein ACFTY8_47290 [Streptomyces mirabilis]
MDVFRAGAAQLVQDTVGLLDALPEGAGPPRTRGWKRSVPRTACSSRA